MQLTVGKLSLFDQPIRLKHIAVQLKVVGTAPVEEWHCTLYVGKAQHKYVLLNEQQELLAITCGKCGNWYTPDGFFVDKAKWTGRAASCKACRAKNIRKFRRNNPRYYHKYYKKNREHILQLSRRNKQARSEIATAKRAYWESLCVPPDNAYLAVINQDKTCVVTGATVNTELDHIMPVSRGTWGSNKGNLLWLSHGLNVSKGNNNVFTWMADMQQERLDYLVPEGTTCTLDHFHEQMTVALTSKAAELGLTLEQYKQKYNEDYGKTSPTVE